MYDRDSIRADFGEPSGARRGSYRQHHDERRIGLDQSIRYRGRARRRSVYLLADESIVRRFRRWSSERATDGDGYEPERGDDDRLDDRAIRNERRRLRRYRRRLCGWHDVTPDRATLYGRAKVHAGKLRRAIGDAYR